MHLKELHVYWSYMDSKWHGNLYVKLPHVGEVSVPLSHEVCRDILAGAAHSPSVISTCTQASKELSGVCNVDSEQFILDDPFK